MEQVNKTDHALKPKRVIYHLESADAAFIVVPLISVAILIGIFTFAGNSGMFEGFIFVLGGIVFFVFLVIYMSLVVILALITRRNLTFRISLIAGFVSTPAIFCILFFILAMLPDGWLNYFL